MISTATDTVVATINLNYPGTQVAIGKDPANPNVNFVYVTQGGTGTVAVINSATNTVIETLTVGEEPFGVAVSPTTGYAYVTNSGDGTVSVIEPARLLPPAVAKTIQLAYFDGSPLNVEPTGVAVIPDGGSVYVPWSYGDVAVIDTATNAVTTITNGLQGGAAPVGVAISPVAPTGYVTFNDQPYFSFVEKLDTATNTFTNTVVGVHPLHSSGGGVEPGRQ